MGDTFFILHMYRERNIENEDQLKGLLQLLEQQLSLTRVADQDMDQDLQELENSQPLLPSALFQVAYGPNHIFNILDKLNLFPLYRVSRTNNSKPMMRGKPQNILRIRCSNRQSSSLYHQQLRLGRAIFGQALRFCFHHLRHTRRSMLH